MLNTKNLLKKLHENYSTQTNLEFSNIHELLFAVILSAQTTDKQVNKLTKKLFKKYKTLEDYATANLSCLKQDINSIGLYNAKAKNIKNSANIILKKFKGKIPSTLQELLLLPGVGRKTANVVLAYGFNKAEGIAVDTHVKRITQRMGLTKNKTPEKIEQDLMKLLPKKEWSTFTHMIIEHGRKLCTARNPKCNECFLKEKCPRFLS